MNNTTMQTAQQQSYGLDTEVVGARSPVGEDEVLVKVAAAGSRPRHLAPDDRSALRWRVW